MIDPKAYATETCFVCGAATEKGTEASWRARHETPAKAEAFEEARRAVLLLLSRKPVVTALDVQSLGNPYDGKSGFDRCTHPNAAVPGICEPPKVVCPDCGKAWT